MVKLPWGDHHVYEAVGLVDAWLIDEKIDRQLDLPLRIYRYFQNVMGPAWKGRYALFMFRFFLPYNGVIHFSPLVCQDATEDTVVQKNMRVDAVNA